MNQSQNSQISQSPQKKQQQYFPAITFKTTDSPQKGSILHSNQLFSQNLQNKLYNRKVTRNKELQLEKAYTIRKYLQVGSLIQGDSLMSHTKISKNVSVTEQKDNSIETKYWVSPLMQLTKKEETLSIMRLLDVNHTQPNICIKQQSQSSIHNQCILELDQEQEEVDHKNSFKDQDKIRISPILQTNFKEISENIISKSQSPNKHNILLKINEQNKDYKKYASQMIRMIRNKQQTLIKEFDLEQINLERDNKQRKEAQQIDQKRIKNKQLRLMMMAFKGSQDKIMSNCQIFLNLGRKIQSRKQSQQKIYQQLPFDKQFDNRNFCKHSTKSDICSLETSLELPLQIQKLI